MCWLCVFVVCVFVVCVCCVCLLCLFKVCVCELYKLANRSQGHGAYDRTRYGRTRASPTSFVTHHTQQISKAAVVNDSKAILKCIISLMCTP